ASVVTVERRAKVLLIELSSKYSLVIHLKMTGQLVFVADANTAGPASSSSPAVLTALRAAGVPQDESPASKLDPSETSLRFGAGHPSDSLVNELPDKTTRVIFTFTDGSRLFFNDQRKFGWVRLLPTAEVPNIDFFKKVGPEPLAARKSVL